MPKQTLKRRADGRYQKRITLSNGKTRLVYGRTEAALKAAVRSVQAQDEAGLEVGDHTLVGEWAKIWLRSYKQGLRPATTKMYRDAYNLHIMQHIGCMELQKALGQLEKRERHYLAVAVDGGMRRLDAAEIYYLESEGHKVHFYTEKEDFVVPGTLKNYEEKLVGRAFARCNSGYLVNLAQVSGVQQDMVQVGPYALQISRPRRKAFMAELADYIGGAGQ